MHVVPLGDPVAPGQPSTLAALLKLSVPPLTRGGHSRPHQQLKCIENHVRHHDRLPCQSVGVEYDCVDRDYMEEFSVFYSRCFIVPENACRRLHFFALEARQVKRHIERLRKTAATATKEDFAATCAEFSDKYYLGFSVIKPLPGCPIGRTVLRCYEPHKQPGIDRQYSATRMYQVHVDGIELTVHGLGFQQQDAGASACATTALWTSIQGQTKFETISLATPAEITMRAAAVAMEHGRAMPSDGLSLNQMCLAVNASGLAPSVVKVGGQAHPKAALYSALRSGFAPVLVLRRGARGARHAVTAVGMQIADLNAHPPPGMPALDTSGTVTTGYNAGRDIDHAALSRDLPGA